MATALIVLLLLSSALVAVQARPTGAPADACDSLSPSVSAHGAQPQGTASPYVVGLSPFYANGQYLYTPGRTYTVILNSTDGSTFRGFLVQSRLTADNSTRVGTFAVASGTNAQLLSCPNTGSSITHTENSDKAYIEIEWTAPPAGTGPVYFAFAVVQTRMVFWANIRGPMIQEEPDECGNNCDINAACDDIGNGTYECRCNNYYGYIGDGFTCEDACNGTCSPYAECEYNGVGYECRCEYGFSGDGQSCEDINECEPNSGLSNDCESQIQDSVCYNTMGSYDCMCEPGYYINDAMDACLPDSTSDGDVYQLEPTIIQDRVDCYPTDSEAERQNISYRVVNILQNRYESSSASGSGSGST